MKSILVLFAICLTGLIAKQASARTLIVDKSGLGQYTSIQAGVNAALPGDTVKVYPGVYNEQVTISTNIVLEGSGYEYTQIVSNTSPTLSMSTGKILWFAISCNTGEAVVMGGGDFANCVVWNCPYWGLSVNSGSGSIVQNSDFINCNNDNQDQAGAIGGATVATFINCIFYYWSGSNGAVGSANIAYNNGWPTLNVLYCCSTNSGTGNINSNPQLTSQTDFTLSGSSPCVNSGDPSMYDPDGSRSSMGYYGGPDAPVFPVVTNLHIYLNPDGTVNVQATAQSRY